MLALSGVATRSHALIVQGAQGMPRPPKGYMGRYNGSSGTAIAPRWLISAKHCQGGIGSSFILRGETFTVVEAVLHPWMDLQLLRVDRDMPGWHALAESVSVGQNVIMAGWGRTAGAVLANNAGYDWAGGWQETWGANKLSFIGGSLGTTFDAPGSSNAVAFESQGAMNDSGGAIFVVDPNGTLRLAGVMTSVTTMNQARYGDSTFSVNLVPVREWIVSNIGTLSVISHGVQGASGSPMPQAAPTTPANASTPNSQRSRNDWRGARTERRTGAAATQGSPQAPTEPTPGTSTSGAPQATGAVHTPTASVPPPHRARARGAERPR